jgi:hypothetical protein
MRKPIAALRGERAPYGSRSTEGSEMQLRHKRPDHTAHERTEEAENSAADALDTWITELAAALGVDATTIDRC